MTRDARQPPDVPRPRAAYSPVVVAGPLVFTAGQVAFGPDDTLVAGGVEEQTRQVLATSNAAWPRLAVGWTTWSRSRRS
jgi:Putative translation initiation inhibitor, yjgF family